MLPIIRAIITLTVVFSTCSSEKIKYDNYHVYNILPRSVNEIKLLNEFDASSDSLIFVEGVQNLGKETQVIVAPHKIPDFTKILNENKIQHKLVEKNFQRILDLENSHSSRSIEKYDWQSYHTLEETYTWLHNLAKNNPENIELLVGGKSYEGREILGVKLSKKPNNKGIFIEAGIHAREWISPATVTYILNELVNNSDPKIREIAENFDWYIFPHVNPDGYAYTHSTDRMWRKTRSPQGVCYGVDPNRNWDFHWNEIGSSSAPCSETYAGKSAFSESEIRSISNFIASLKGKIHTYISFHSYSQLLLFPYGHSKEHAKNHNDLQQIGKAAAKALAQRYGTRYIVGNIYEAIYPASGSSIDWAYAKQNVSLSYTYELRPSGGLNGFVLPAKEIIPTGEETLDSLVALLNEGKQLGYF